MSTKNYTLGLDIGTTSIGWALIDFQSEVIIDRGVRIFTVAENPKDGSSLAAPRREKRTSRRTIRRRAGRMKAVRQLLIDNKIITENDLKAMYPVGTKKNKIDDPWELRYKGLSKKLDSKEWARVLIHIAKRRGYSFSIGDKADEKSKVKSGIQTNHKLLGEKYQTIGELFYTEYKEEEGKRKRNTNNDYQHSVSRADLEKEIHVLFEKQKELGNPYTTKEILNKYIEIFNRQEHFDKGGNVADKIGNCLFEKNELRAPSMSVAAAKASLLQTLHNHIDIKTDEGYRKLNKNEKEQVVNKVLTTTITNKTINYLKYADISKLLKIEENGEELRINKRILSEKQEKKEVQGVKKFSAYFEVRKVLLEKGTVKEDNAEIIDKIITTLTYHKNPEKRKEELNRIDILQGETELIDELMELNYSKVDNLSLKAINKILQYLYDTDYTTACSKAGYDPNKIISDDNTTNPVVNRAFTQVKKLVKAITKKHGNPTSINIELARDLNKSFDERRDIEKYQKENLSKKEKAKQEFITQFGTLPRGDDLFKYELYKNQNGKCVYSAPPNDEININRLFEKGYTEIDHIIPYSISFDNSKNNRVLCLAKQNQDKKNRTPYHWLGKDTTRWDIFVDRSKAMKLDKNKTDKLIDTRSIAEIEQDSKERHINDTRYIARVVKNYLEKEIQFADDPTYTGEQSKRLKVLTISGSVTGYIRHHWGLNGLKYRDDSGKRESDLNHAVDAVVIACTTPSMIKRISDYTGKHGTSEIWQKVPVVDMETGEVLREVYKAVEFPTPWGDHDTFRHEVKAILSDPTRIKEQHNVEQPVEKKKGRKAKSSEAVEKHKSPEELLKRHGLLDKYITNNANINPVFVSRMPTRKIMGEVHQETIRSKQEINGEEKIISKISPEKLEKKHLDNLIYKDIDPILYAHVETWLDNKKEGQLIHPARGSIVKSLKIYDDTKSYIDVRGGVANNGDMIRIDVFEKNGKYFIVPIYTKDINKPLPNLAVIQGKHESNWEPVDDSEFIFSLYPNDIVNISGNMYYYISADRSTSNIGVESHDSYNKITGKGLKTEKEIKKYNVDILGNLQEVKQEKRLPLNLK